MFHPSIRPLRAALAALAIVAATAGAFPVAAAPTLEEGVVELQREWEVIRYQTPQKEREKRLEALAAKAHKLSEAWPGKSEALIWEGIVTSSWAGEKGGLGALGLAKQARALYESALGIEPEALGGSAYNSLAVLYYKVPGWPLGFGDKDKARELLQKGLALNPKGIDPNFFYGEFLLESGDSAQALTYLEKALQAPPRPGRQIADAGRREEARALIAKIRGER